MGGAIQLTDTIYTTGYSGFAVDEMIALLRAHRISVLIDVRSQPYSRHFPDFNREALEKTLRRQNIHYRNYAVEFGARQNDPQYIAPGGYLDFERYTKSDRFLTGFEKVRQSMQQGFRFVLMCAEKDPIDCHRTSMVARAFHDAGVSVVHLLPGNVTQTQQDVEARLVDRYFPGRHQVSLFDGGLSEQEYIMLAYRKCNEEIGYRQQGD